MHPSVVLRRWTYRPVAPTESRTRTSEGRRNSLPAALRAAHAAGVRFVLSVSSGPGAALELVTRDAISARWVSRVLSPAYESREWQERPSAAAPPPDRPRWIVLRQSGWPTPLRGVGDAVGLCEAWLLAFRTLGPGARLELDVRSQPGRFATSILGPAPERPVPRTSRAVSAPPSEPRRSPTPTIEQSPFWLARGTLDCTGRVRPGDTDPVVRAVEAASRSAGGNGLWCRRQSPWSWPRAPAFALTESELTLVLPSLSPPPILASTQGREEGGSVLPLGRDGAGTVVGPPVEAHQGRHLVVLGETGMGKSSLLVALARRVAGGAGLVVLDPLGDTAETVRRELSPLVGERLRWIDAETGPGLNALAGAREMTETDPVGAERRLNDLVHALRRVRSGRYPDASFWGPRLEEMLSRALRVAALLPDGTLVEAHRLLASGGRGFRSLPPDAVGPGWELAERIRARPEDADGAQRLLYEVVRSPVLQRMLCDPGGATTPREWVAPGRVALLSGAAASVGETTARYLLSVDLALLWSELLARRERSKTFVLLDEAQWFGHESLAEMLRLGRRANVHVVLATQALASLPPPVAEAVWTNVADFVSFRGSFDEARELARVGDGVRAEAILSLARGEAAVLLGKGASVRWVRAARVPSSPPVPRAAPPDPKNSTPRPGPVPAPANRTSGGETETPREPGPGVAAVIALLRRKADEGKPSEPFAVSLPSLRRAVDPTGAAVRAAGSWLRHVGAITRAAHDDAGAVWWIDPGRLTGAFDPRDPEHGPPAEDEAKS